MFIHVTKTYLQQNIQIDVFYQSHYASILRVTEMVQNLPEHNSVNLKTEAGSPSEILAQTKSATADHTMGDKLPVP